MGIEIEMEPLSRNMKKLMKRQYAKNIFPDGLQHPLRISILLEKEKLNYLSIT